jgi:potassium-dependent mechanosensitive channel
MKRFVIFLLLCSVGLGVYSQSRHNQTSVSDNQQPRPRLNSGRVRTKIDGEALLFKQSIEKKSALTVDSLTSSDYIMSIERINDNLNSIRDSANLGFEVIRMKRKIDKMTLDIRLIRQNSRSRNSVVNIKNLYLYQSFANNLDKESNQIQSHLLKTYNRVYNAKLGLRKALSDSVFRVLNADSALSKTLNVKLVRLERKWIRTDSTTKANVDTLNALKVKMADNSMNLSNMLNMMDIRLDKAGKQLFGPEANPLWQKVKKDTTANDSSKKVMSMLGNEQKAIGYYFSQTSGQRTLVLFLGIMLFIWLFLKRKVLKTLRQPNSTFSFLHLEYLGSYPVFSLLVLLLCLMPFFDAYAPTSYIATEYLLLLSFSSVIFFKKENSYFRLTWSMVVALFIVYAIIYLLIEPTLVSRIFLLAVQVSIIVFSFLFYRNIRKEVPYYKWIKRAAIIGIILSMLGVICNLYGRISLSGILGLTGVFALTQAIVLPVFIETSIEIMLLQLQSSRMKKGYSKPFDSSIVIEKIKMPLAIIALILWLMMLASNLNLYHGITNSVTDLLTTTRTIGSISFRLVSVLWFFIIIWIAHILQQLISFLFGETGNETDDTTPVSKKQHSRLLVTRLLVLVGGYLLAIAASGLPIDKLTFLLGALGVGIGMGLQNVVNNFVSGIILIFDGSLQIGDVIEVSGQSGKVKEIGLRASTLSTADGAEVIIPNGNILSQNIVNWTFSNDQRRVMVWFSLTGKELDSNVINEVINETIANISGVVSQKKPVILYTRVTPETCAITVRFWCTINNADSVKSEAMIKLSAAFETKNIKFE